MARGLMRWPAVAGAACLAVMVMLYHDAPTYAVAYQGSTARRRVEVFDSLQMLGQSIDSIELRSGEAHRLLSVGRRSRGFSVVDQVDSSAFRAVPDSIGRFFDSTWARQPARDRSISVLIRISDRGRLAVTMHPIALDGVTCVSTVFPRSNETAQFAEHSLSACGYYAAFGRPGPAIERWFTTSAIGFQTDPPGWRPEPDSTDWNQRQRAMWVDGGWALRLVRGDLPAPYDYSADLARCAAGRSGVCTDAALTLIPSPKLWWFNTAWGTEGGIGQLAVSLLPDLVHDFGPDRFRTFWKSPDAVPIAFERAFGVSLDDWVRGEVIAYYGPLQLGAG
ncbi:MAG: hypothetical protein ACREOE_01725, partial [Gemmatimonadales bacterium]